MVADRKRYRHDQSREGVAARRELEFAVVMDQVKRRKAKFMARLQGRIKPVGDCLCYQGTLDHKGHARLNIRYKFHPSLPASHITIHAHRLFLILKTKAPIPLEYEAGHLPKCEHRTCVKHLRLEHYTDNAVTNKRAA